MARKQNEVRSRARLRLLRKGGEHTRAEIAKLWAIQEGKCYYTGRPLGEALKTSRHAKDHLVALANRGKNTIANIVLCLLEVNAAKANLSRDAFIRAYRISLAQQRTMSLIDTRKRKAFTDIPSR